MIKPGRNTLIFFGVALAIQAGILLSFQFAQQRLLAAGRTITVQAVPVDPRDLFRGDYVTLHYAFSRLDRAGLKDTLGSELPRSARVYVRLRQNADADWRPAAVGRRPFGRLAKDEVMLAGNVTGFGPDFLDVAYGCESYYVPEGEGRKIETKIREHKVTVDLSVTPKGRVQPVKLLVDGKQIVFGE